MGQRCKKCKIIFVIEAGGIDINNCPICKGEFEIALVPNFFNRGNLEDLVDEKISKEDFEEFVNWADGLADPVSDLVRCSWEDYFEEKEEEKEKNE